jgi:hypothetical protein
VDLLEYAAQAWTPPPFELQKLITPWFETAPSAQVWQPVPAATYTPVWFGSSAQVPGPNVYSDLVTSGLAEAWAWNRPAQQVVWDGVLSHTLRHDPLLDPLYRDLSGSGGWLGEQWTSFRGSNDFLPAVETLGLRSRTLLHGLRSGLAVAARQGRRLVPIAKTVFDLSSFTPQGVAWKLAQIAAEELVVSGGKYLYRQYKDYKPASNPRYPVPIPRYRSGFQASLVQATPEGFACFLPPSDGGGNPTEDEPTSPLLGRVDNQSTQMPRLLTRFDDCLR